MSIHKRTVLGKLPPNVVLHLNRFKMNLDTFQTEKVNTRFEFPASLDLEPFTKEVRKIILRAHLSLALHLGLLQRYIGPPR